MTNIFADFRRLVLAAIDDLAANGELPSRLDLRRVAVEPPRDPAHGDLSTNAAMVLGGAVRENPMALAGRIAAALAGREFVTGDYCGGGFTVAPAKPGFINIRLAPEVWHAQLRAVLRVGTTFGDSTIGRGERVLHQADERLAVQVRARPGRTLAVVLALQTHDPRRDLSARVAGVLLVAPFHGKRV